MSESAPVPARVKPLFVIKPGTMSPRDIRRAEKLAGICIVECKEPEEARFLVPPPDAQIDKQAAAAYALMRWVATSAGWSVNYSKAELINWFVNKLIEQPQQKPVPHVKGNS